MNKLWNQEEYEARVIACLSACEGMSDPSAEIAALRAQKYDLLMALKCALPVIEYENYSDQELIDGRYGIAEVLIPIRAAIRRAEATP